MLLEGHIRRQSGFQLAIIFHQGELNRKHRGFAAFQRLNVARRGARNHHQRRFGGLHHLESEPAYDYGYVPETRIGEPEVADSPNYRLAPNVVGCNSSFDS